MIVFVKSSVVRKSLSKLRFFLATYCLINTVLRRVLKRAKHLVDGINNFLILLKPRLLLNARFYKHFGCFYLISSQNDNFYRNFCNTFDLYF